MADSLARDARRRRRRSLPPVLVLFALAATLAPRDAASQNSIVKRVGQGAFCAGFGYAGYRLGEKIADIEIKRQALAGKEAEQLKRGLQIGAALIFCKGGTMVAGTVYDRLSKRDMEAREREMNAALADASPEARRYVLPESQLQGTITAQPAVVEGNRECRTVVDNLADAQEPAIVKYCRSSGGQWEPQLF